jgi:glucokinase
LILGFDVGGSKISMFLSDRNGNILRRSRVRTPDFKRPEDLIEQLVTMSRDAEHAAASDIETVSVVFAGAVDGKRGIIRSSPNLFGGIEIPLSDILEDILKKTVYIENDATATAISEKIFGNGKAFSNFIYLTLSTGIGGGIFMNNRVYRGSLGMAGEFGHMVVDPQGPVCGCGRKGCFEAVAGGKAALKIMDRIKAYERSECLRQTPRENVEAKQIFECAEKGDPPCLEVVGELTKNMEEGVASLINIFDPEAVMVGGGLSNSKKLVYESIEKNSPSLLATMKRDVKFFRTSQVTVELSPMAVVLYEEEIPGFNIERIIKEMKERITVAREKRDGF